MDYFHFLSDKGKISLPNKFEIEKHFEETGEQIILVLDSCVCIDVVKLVNWKAEAKSEKTKIFNLIDYVQKNDIMFLPIFALIESCYDRETLKIKSEKLFDYNSKIQFAFEFPLKKFKRYQYNFEYDFYAVRPNTSSEEAAELVIESRVNIYYAGLLKISQIAQKYGLSQNKAERNIEFFVDWMEKELDCFLGFEYTLAVNIFGGNSQYGSMLKINSSKQSIIRAAWATAWDLFHAKMSINGELVSKLIDKKAYPIFVTKDNNLFNLMSPYVHLYVRRGFKKVTITKNTSYPPFYKYEFIERLNDRMTDFSLNRFERDVQIDYNKVKIIIEKLEESLN